MACVSGVFVRVFPANEEGRPLRRLEGWSPRVSEEEVTGHQNSSLLTSGQPLHTLPTLPTMP